LTWVFYFKRRNGLFPQVETILKEKATAFEDQALVQGKATAFEEEQA